MSVISKIKPDLTLASDSPLLILLILSHSSYLLYGMGLVEMLGFSLTLGTPIWALISAGSILVVVVLCFF